VTSFLSSAKRLSFTQYTAGGIFRWVNHSFQSIEDDLSGLNDEQLVEEELRSAGRWSKDIDLFSTLTSLQQPPSFGKARMMILGGLKAVVNPPKKASGGVLNEREPFCRAKQASHTMIYFIPTKPTTSFCGAN
jgi:hypothetical protein